MKNKTKYFLLSIILFTINAKSQNDFVVGADMSWLQQVEAGGGVFKENGIQKDPLLILKQNGFTHIRLRIWNSPTNGINNLANTLLMAKRINQNGLKLFLDYHFSDTWADPGQQAIPSKWKNLPFDILKDSVKNFVFYTISELKKQGTLPSIVQFGNEIICGMLWNQANVCGVYNTEPQWIKLSELLQSAHNGMLDAISPTEKIKTMIHIDRGGNHNESKSFFDNLMKYYNSFDIIGLSYYPWWHGTIFAMNDNATKLATKFNKEIILAEIAYPFTLGWNDNENNIVGSQNQLHAGYPATVDGQKNFLKDITTKVKNLPQQKGKGIVYWEPGGISAPQWTSPWENLALFGFDNEVLSSISVFKDSGLTFNDEKIKIENYSLSQNFPNPFNPTTTIIYKLKENNFTSLKVYDIFGKEISILINEKQSAGNYKIEFNATNFASGIYFYKLCSGNFIQTKKMMVVK